MRSRRSNVLVFALSIAIALTAASGDEDITQTRFGDGSLPQACQLEMQEVLTAEMAAALNETPPPPAPEYEKGVSATALDLLMPASPAPPDPEVWKEGDHNPAYWYGEGFGRGAICHHMRTGLNALDSPQIDVLVLVPLSPMAERDMRIMRQSIEMWEGGIDHLAASMGLQWLADGVDFHITIDYFDPTGDGGEFTTYPIVDPEIVVVGSNPVGGLGIGIDPLDFNRQVAEILGLPADGEGLCHGIPNLADMSFWEAVPGFDSHHDGRTGTFTEDCDGSGGNICFAVNGAVDPVPGEDAFYDNVVDFNLFDLVAHEVGHCLTLGHVGDGAEGYWAQVPTNDIMAYHSDPPGITKCVSTLDVEGFALRMSRYLDVNGDEVIDEADHLLSNDQVGQGVNAFQVQLPEHHLYASASGDPMDCPQPDLGPIPTGRTDWTPDPA